MDCFDLSNAQKRTIITEISNHGNEAYIISFKSNFPLEDEEHVKKALSILISGNLQLRMRKDENMNFSQYYADEEGSVTTAEKGENSPHSSDEMDENTEDKNREDGNTGDKNKEDENTVFSIIDLTGEV